MKRILSIDGGGVKGIVPALICAEIESRTGKRISDLFDFIAGTSTGGILALGMTSPIPLTASEIVELYEKESSTIFNRPFLHKIRSLFGLTEQKYPVSGLKRVLTKYFKWARIRQARKPVMITSYCMAQGKPYFFKSWEAKKKPEQYDFSMEQVAQATSSAPTYFDPLHMIKEGKEHSFIDGGIVANNPVMCALSEAMRLFPNERDFLVLSLSTGSRPKRFKHEKISDWGALRWLRPALDLLLDAPAAAATYQARAVIESMNSGRLFRWKPELASENMKMDNASKSNVNSLKKVVAQFIADHDTEFNELMTLLKKPDKPRLGF